MQLLENMPCAVKLNNFWYRGQIIKWIGSSALIRFVDFGSEKLVAFELIQPLLSKFGRFPPFALGSKLAGKKYPFLNEDHKDEHVV